MIFPSSQSLVFQCTHTHTHTRTKNPPVCTHQYTRLGINSFVPFLRLANFPFRSVRSVRSHVVTLSYLPFMWHPFNSFKSAQSTQQSVETLVDVTMYIYKAHQWRVYSLDPLLRTFRSSTSSNTQTLVAAIEYEEKPGHINRVAVAIVTVAVAFSLQDAKFLPPYRRQRR